MMNTVFTPLYQPVRRLLLSSSNGRKMLGLMNNQKVQEYGMLIPLSLAMTGLKVLLHGKAYEKEGFQAEDRRLLYVQEAVRQTISTVLWLGTLCISYEFVVGRLFPGSSKLGKVLLSNVISQVPDTFLRPFLTAKVSKWLLGTESSVKRTKQPQPETALQMPKLQEKLEHQPVKSFNTSMLSEPVTQKTAWAGVNPTPTYFAGPPIPSYFSGYPLYGFYR